MTKLIKNIYQFHRSLFLMYTCVALLITLLSIFLISKPLPLLFALLTLCGVFFNSLLFKNGQLFFAFAAVVYIIMAYSERFFGELIIYAIFVVLYIVSFLRWDNNRKKTKIRSMSLFEFSVMGIILITCTPIYYFFLYNINTSQLIINSISTMINCFAVYCTVKKMWQQFYFWIMINFIQALLWTTTFSIDNLNSMPILLSNIFLFSINIYNLFKWKNNYVTNIEGQRS